MYKQLLTLFLTTILCACSTQKSITDAQYTQNLRRDIPFSVTDISKVKDDIYTFHCDKYIDLLPDYEVDEDAAEAIYRTTFLNSNDKQSPQLIWRNIVISKKNHRVLCIDRFVKDNKTFGYIYVLQGETKGIPNGYHWDVTDHRLMLVVADAIESYTPFAVDMLKLMNN